MSEVRDVNKPGDLFADSEGNVYVLVKTALGFLAVDLRDGGTYDGLKRLMSTVLEGLEPLGYSLNMKEGKRWSER